ncbi:MAG: hypothetical protein J6Z26_08595, partial [Bacteroidales bacterium]|nr:hypothetical protein [Bacteroidales bacterium]
LKLLFFLLYVSLSKDRLFSPRRYQKSHWFFLHSETLVLSEFVFTPTLRSGILRFAIKTATGYFFMWGY